MLSETDNRVLAFLRNRRKAKVAAVGESCFREPGKPKSSGNLPAAAHLARMVQAGLVTKDRFGNYAVSAEPQEQQLFPS